ncbi:hypothetical protein [Actinokineospora pegani]|uniref:hypothetical protein n=1 Tax=Actinokineospora pegani TaxID=2654637 RepID=UPI0012EAC6FA|nr:hypothetical protein [Actinokineospora pegani]
MAAKKNTAASLDDVKSRFSQVLAQKSGGSHPTAGHRGKGVGGGNAVPAPRKHMLPRKTG